jgi:sec-independent protein translocase protein TatA
MIQSTFLLFNIGGAELLVIVFIIIMFFGADKIPEIARGLGKGIRTVRNAANDVKREITESATADSDLHEVKNTLEEGKKQLNELAGTIKRNTGI